MGGPGTQEAYRFEGATGELGTATEAPFDVKPVVPGWRGTHPSVIAGIKQEVVPGIDFIMCTEMKRFFARVEFFYSTTRTGTHQLQERLEESGS